MFKSFLHYRLMISSLLCIPMALYAMIAPFAFLLPSHAFEKTWPDHARFHLMWAAGKLFALGTGQLLLALFGLRAGQRWVWFTMLSNIVFGGLVMFPASRIAHGPVAPFRAHDRSTRFAVITFVAAGLGLMLAIPSIFRKHK